MKNLTLLVALLIFSLKCFSQTKNVKTYHDPLSKTKVHESYTALTTPPYKKNGLYREWDVKGTLIREIHYKNGEKDGIANSYNPIYDPQEADCYGKQLTAANYKNNKRFGVQKTFYCYNGKLQLAEELVYEDNEDVVKRINYYHNGNLEKSIQKNGICKEWYDNGKPKAEYTLKNGTEHGSKTLWYENGQVKMKSNLIDGKEAGEGFAYFEDGKLMAKYIADPKTSYYKELERYFRHGKKKSVLELSNEFYITTYYDSISGGIVRKSSEKIVNDKLIFHGPINFYDATGNIIAGGEYLNNKQIGIWKFFVDKENKLTDDLASAIQIIEIKYDQSGNYNDSITKYSLSGKKISEGIISIKANGKIIESGQFKEYFESGTKRSEGEYVYGKKVKDWNVFDEFGKLQKIETYDNEGKLIKSLTNEEILAKQVADLKKQIVSVYSNMITQNSNPVVIKYYYSNDKDKELIFNKALIVHDFYFSQVNNCNDLNCLNSIKSKLDNMYNKLNEMPQDNAQKAVRKLSLTNKVSKIEEILEI